MTDPITDMFNRIRNAQAVQKETIDVPFSKFKYQIAKILKENGFVGSIERKGRSTRKFISIALRYAPDKNTVRKNTPAIRGIRRVSKPGQRIYVSVEDLKRMHRRGVAIISTSKGLMTDREARQQKLGGEVICEVW